MDTTKKQKSLVSDKSRIDAVIYGNEPSQIHETRRSILPLIGLAFLFFFTLLMNTVLFKGKMTQQHHSKNVVSVRRMTERWTEDWGMTSYRTDDDQDKTYSSESNIEEGDEGDYVEQDLSELIRNGNVMKGGTAIVILLEDQKVQQLDSLKNSLLTLSFLQGDDPDALAPVLIFCEEENQLSHEDKSSLTSSTNRPIAFPLIPQEHTKSNQRIKKTPAANETDHGDTSTASENDTSESNHNPPYKFWISKLHNHPALQNFDIVFKLSTNFCFRTFNDQLPALDKPVSYHAAYEEFVNVTIDENIAILDFAKHYMVSHKIVPENKKMWDHFITTSKEMQYLPYFSTNFELVRKNIFQRKDVLNWYSFLQNIGSDLFQDGINEQKLQGILQFLTVAMFMKDEEIRTTNAAGFHYGSEECAPEDVETALAILY